jgi:hypothetical protein
VLDFEVTEFGVGDISLHFCLLKTKLWSEVLGVGVGNFSLPLMHVKLVSLHKQRGVRSSKLKHEHMEGTFFVHRELF